MFLPARVLIPIRPTAAVLAVVAVLDCISATAAEPSSAAVDAAVVFETKIRPILAGTCFKCHGGEKTSGGLLVDSRDALVKGGDSGPTLVPGDSQHSLLVQALSYADDGLQMPPEGKLADTVIADFAAWIDAGAVWPETIILDVAASTARHWAFLPVVAEEPPPDPSGWSNHPIDRFVAARRQAAGLNPVGQADKRTLLRRLTFDLIGLPPTPDELADFLADESPEAWVQAIDRLLASPHYGERWGRHWMDVAHYADTAGDNADYPVPEARLYRDYIIDTFNADKPFNEFIQEQIAGDLLAMQGPPEKYAERVIATGFLALSRRYATMPFELFHLTIEDTIDTLSSAVLGLTVRCARCHDHKFDPVTTEDYYALYGFFASTRFPYAGSEETQSKGHARSGFVPLVPPEQAKPALDRYAAEIAALEAEIKQLEAADAPATDDPDKGKKLDERRQALRLLRKPGLPADLAGAYAVWEATPVDVPIQLRGEPGQPGPIALRGVPKFISGAGALAIPAGQSGRRELAQWLTSAKNPLTARVFVNRVWQHHFGRGLVATPSNLGLRGSPPTHPELIDWLADNFVKQGWSIKSLHRLILTSRTYQLASTDDSHAASVDPANELYWRYDRRRLDAEAIRDAMLAVSGRLDSARPGEHPFPPIKDWNWTQHSPHKAVYPSTHRSVYLMTQRIQRHPYLALFDGPDTNHSTDVRTSATVPLQALYLMNNPFVTEQANSLAERLISHTADSATRIDYGCELAWGRGPTENERQRMLDFVNQYGSELAAAGLPGVSNEPSHERQCWTSLARVLLTANEFVYID